MELTNSKSSFGWVSIIIHWLSALTIVALFALGWWMVELTYYSEWYQTAPLWHTSVGLLLAALTILRLIWRWTQAEPKGLGAAWEQVGAKLAHWAMYLLMIAIFTSGYLISTADGRGIEVFNWFTVPALGELFNQQEQISGDTHRWLAYVLMALVVLHSLAALKHHFIDKDSTLRRMIKPAKHINGDTK